MWLLYIGTPKYGTCFSCFRPSSGLQPTAPRTFCLIFETPNFLCASLCFNRTSLRRGAPPLSRDWALRGIRSFDPDSYLPVLTSYFGAYSLRRYRLSHPHGSLCGSAPFFVLSRNQARGKCVRVTLVSPLAVEATTSHGNLCNHLLLIWAHQDARGHVLRVWRACCMFCIVSPFCVALCLSPALL